MTAKKVLLVCMFDSIHTAHWIERFQDSEIQFQLIPSKIHKRIHPKILQLVKENQNVNIVTPVWKFTYKVHGYLDYFFDKIQLKLFKQNYRLALLRKSVYLEKFDYIHALEIQGAGYLCDELTIPDDSQLVVTNWGSDIYFYKNDPYHAARIEHLLSKTDRYSAECKRDYKLARDFGFKGIELPVVPNSGGNYDLVPSLKFAKQDLVVVKTYGGVFGRGDLAINAIEKLLLLNNNYHVYFYSVGFDNLKPVKELKNRYPLRIRFSTVDKSIPHENLMALFQRAKIYLGCSESDGISTSFLEAISHGVYPIQTNTSCADEWVSDGICASIVGLDRDEISQELIRVASIWDSLDSEIQNNLHIARNLLSPQKIAEKCMKFYQN